MIHRLWNRKLGFKFSPVCKRFIYTSFYTNSRFAKVDNSPDFSKEEEKVIKYWDEIDAFKKQLEITKHFPPYTFYDGPPFATGLPHYGHLAVGAIKDTVCRYASQNGRYVERRFGWDCHGLPIEYEIDKKLGLKTKKDYDVIGVKAYNDHCREIVMRYSTQWEQIVKRFGRWIDFQNDYKTMDIEFMESVWHIFKNMYEKGLVYKSSRVMPYSTKCNTVLSNFEAGSNYKQIRDPSILITFPLENDNLTSLIAWTTTPWTLPSNLAVAVNSNFNYIKFLNPNDNKYYIIAECRKKEIFSLLKIKNPKIVQTYLGSELENTKYVPLFDYFSKFKSTGGFSILCADFVSDKDGTGIVHCAPGFGEDDFNVCVQKNIIDPGSPPCPMDENGLFDSQIPEYTGVYFKDADKDIKRELKSKGRLLYEGTYDHSYPFCWRSDTPLMYKAVNSWFIKVTSLKDDLVRNNLKSYWVPEMIQKNRFHNWLVDAKDWCFSRNRIWGNPIPLWISEDGEEIVCVGSIQELKELSGRTDITDLHRDFIDDIVIPSKMGKGNLKRIEEVFDCWFESGSMPFAQHHYPFSISEEEFKTKFPGDFIAEGLDQTRGWFYTLNVISTAMKNSEPYKNLIVNGLILAEDGSKMSKSKKNYPDPMKMVDEFSADAVKLYMLNSPVVRAEPLKFATEGVKGVVRNVFLPWYNSYRFLIQNIYRLEEQTGINFNYSPSLRYKSTNILDKWIIGANQNLIKMFRTEMDSYRLYTIIRYLLSFLDDLTKWYIRLNRSRMKGQDGVEEMKMSLNVLFDVLFSTTVMMSCFTPFISEYLYLNLRNGLDLTDKNFKESIHFLNIPEFEQDLLNDEIITSVNHMKKLVELVRQARDNKNIPIKRPVRKVTIINSDQNVSNAVNLLHDYIKSEVNSIEIEVTNEEEKFVTYDIEFNHKSLGQRLQNQYTNQLRTSISSLTKSQLSDLIKNEKIDVDGITILKEDLYLHKKFKEDISNQADKICITDDQYAVLIDCSVDQQMEEMHLLREFITKVQKFRKELNLSIDDNIEILYSAETKMLADVLLKHKETVETSIMKGISIANSDISSSHNHKQIEFELGEEKGAIYIVEKSKIAQ